jgi:hypothetical protein
VLFAGDTAVTVIVPAINDGDGRILEGTLRSLSALGAETLVPGHGAVVVGRDAVRHELVRMAEYLGGVRDAVRRAAARGLDAAAVVDAVSPDPLLVALGRDPERFGQRKRHRDVTTRIAAEEGLRVAAN